MESDASTATDEQMQPQVKPKCANDFWSPAHEINNSNNGNSDSNASAASECKSNNSQVIDADNQTSSSSDACTAPQSPAYDQQALSVHEQQKRQQHQYQESTLVKPAAVTDGSENGSDEEELDFEEGEELGESSRSNARSAKVATTDETTAEQNVPNAHNVDAADVPGRKVICLLKKTKSAEDLEDGEVLSEEEDGEHKDQSPSNAKEQRQTKIRLDPPRPQSIHSRLQVMPRPQSMQDNAWERGMRHAKQMLSRQDDSQFDYSDRRQQVPRGYSYFNHDNRNEHPINEHRNQPYVGGDHRNINQRFDPYRSDYRNDYNRNPHRDFRPHETGREPDDRRLSRHPDQLPSYRPLLPDPIYDSEYERRRRLAFESAPWNTRQPGYDRYGNPITVASNQTYQHSSHHDQRENRDHRIDNYSRHCSDPDSLGRKHLLDRPLSVESGKHQVVEHTSKPQKENWSGSNSSTSTILVLSDSDEEKGTIALKSTTTTIANGLKTVQLTKATHAVTISAQSAKQHQSSKFESRKPVKMTFKRKLTSLKETDVADTFSCHDNISSEEDFVQECSSMRSSSHQKSDAQTTSSEAEKEALLRQLKAVEDAIARKRAKYINDG